MDRRCAVLDGHLVRWALGKTASRGNDVCPHPLQPYPQLTVRWELSASLSSVTPTLCAWVRRGSADHVAKDRRAT